MVKENSKVALLVSLFLVSISLFVFQFTLTRVFSPMLRYHFVFMLTSMAVFGLGIGGLIAYRLGKKCSKHELDFQLSGWLIILASLFILSFSLIYKLPFLNQFAVYSAIAALPFIAGGIFISLVFMRMSENSHKLYFAQMAGAGVGSILVVQFINNLGIVNTVLIVAGLSAICSLIISFYLSKNKQKVIAVCAVITLGLIGSFQQGIKQFERRFTGYFTSPVTSLNRLRSSNIKHRLEDWAWDSYSRTDIIEIVDAPLSKIIAIDGGSNSTMFRFDGDLDKFQNLKSDLMYFPFLLGENKKTLLIGAGGGKIILQALLAGSKKIDVLEINRGTVRMAGKYAEYNGWIYDREEVNVFIQDGRNFVKQTREKYDHIYLSQAMSDAAGTAGYSMAENFIYTREAIEDYWNALGYNGRLTFILHGSKDMTRLISTVLETLKEFGIKKNQISKHIVIINDGSYTGNPDAINIPVVTIKKTPFTQYKMTKLINLIRTNKYGTLHLPYIADRGFIDQFLQITNKNKQFYNYSSLNIDPTTDDRPYFYDFNRGINYTLLTLLGGTLFLGHPTRSFTVIMAALSTGGGIGSLVGEWKKFLWKDRYLPLILVPLSMVLVYSLYYGVINKWIVSTMAIRIFISFVLVFPLGFFMGMPFPLGIKILKQKNHENAVPLMLGLNGTMAIGSSVLAVIISMKIGFSYSLAAGGLIYLLLFLIMPIYEKGWMVN